MADIFPIRPSLGQLYTSENLNTYRWDGSSWNLYSGPGYLTSGSTSGGSSTFSGGTVTGPTYFSNGVSANTISATTYLNLPSSSFSGGTVTGPTYFSNGVSANTISATTFLNLPIDIRVTGGTYSNGTATFTNNTGGTFTVTGFSTSTSFTGGTVTGATNFTGGLTANTISATTYQNLPTDIRVTGATYSNNNFTYTNNTGGTFSVLFNTVTGLTVNGNLSVTGTTSSDTISATTYQNLPVSGLTQGSNITITNNGSGNFTISSTAGGGTFTGGTVTGATNFTGGLSANTFSAQTISTTGLTGSVALISQRNAIPTSLRYWGMLCEVYADTNPDNNGTYKLTYNYANTTLSDNNNWALSLDAYSLTLCF